jgi:hypothetical protein
MRRTLVAVALVVAGCQDGAAVSTSAPESTVGTTTTTAATTSTSTTPTSTTTTAPVETTTTSTLPELQGIAYQPVLTGFETPVFLTARPGEGTAVLATKAGRLWSLTGDRVSDEPILDISGRVRNEGERGLLGGALHPTDPARLFLHYSDAGGDTVVSEFAVAPDGSIDAASERILLALDQPASNHNGGVLQFGGEGLLYLGLGDGGGAGDDFGNGQADTLLAGLVAIDVDSAEATKFAKGLRNPWRFWIDGDLVYVADVGQNAYEEVDVAPLTAGLNYGWPIAEGLHCYSPRADCDTTGLVAPLVEIEHGDGGACSVTGGVVYRGAAIPELAGHYFYSDYCGGWLRSLLYDGSEVVDQRDWTDQVGVPGAVTSFGTDGANEMYVLTTDSVLRVVPVR